MNLICQFWKQTLPGFLFYNFTESNIHDRTPWNYYKFYSSCISTLRVSVQGFSSLNLRNISRLSHEFIIEAKNVTMGYQHWISFTEGKQQCVLPHKLEVTYCVERHTTRPFLQWGRNNFQAIISTRRRSFTWAPYGRKYTSQITLFTHTQTHNLVKGVKMKAKIL